jgi:DNA helicase-2/ATP-dependent DNA helicase PcrA
MFAQRWEAWKHAYHLTDFTDMLETALQDMKFAPGCPSVIFVDEAQDLSRLQLELLRQWGRHADHLVLAGDDDQTIYTFAGAAPEVLLEHKIPESFRHVLAQSYLVPHTVHALSQASIQKVAIREPKAYLPRDAGGEVRLLHKGSYKYPEPIVDDAERYIANGKTVMLLTSCSYMLEP